MRLSARCVLALGLAAIAAQPAAARARKPAAAEPAAPAILVVSAHDEAERANPGLYRRQPAAAPRQQEQFRAALDDVFGEGRWRQTSGYRTVAEENALRRHGAGTVAPGRISRHSVGGRETPGAYDVVAPGMTAAQAAAKLKAAGQGWGRIVAESAHGREGAHLHLELAPADAPASAGR
ncbi:MAG: hypothetical protein JSS35_18735 [Proteobacteria bacterium]|nr:hypothetical protein [Pseudomonadota bacterium]